jgi:hypothetical protein
VCPSLAASPPVKQQFACELEKKGVSGSSRGEKERERKAGGEGGGGRRETRVGVGRSG